MDLFPDEHFQKFQENMEGYDIIVKIGDSIEILPTLEEKYGLIFIDSMHTEPHISQDIQNAWNLLEDNGILAIHDYNNLKWTDVRKAVQNFMLANSIGFYKQTGSANLIALRKYVPTPEQV